MISLGRFVMYYVETTFKTELKKKVPIMCSLSIEMSRLSTLEFRFHYLITLYKVKQSFNGFSFSLQSCATIN